MLDPADLQAIWLTVKLASVTTVLLLIIGTPIAWWLARTRSWWKGPVGAVVALPIVLPPAVLGFYRGGYELALVIGLTMVLLAVMSNLVGAALPFVFKRLRIDPAVASGPLITTVADTVGLVIYFTIARMVLA